MFDRWANESLRQQNSELKEEIRKLRSLARIQQLEIDELAAIVARNQKRIEAETATAARQIAAEQHETTGNENGARRFTL